MGKANFKFAGICALGLALANVLVAWGEGLPIRDPDGVAVPTYIRLPAILLVAWLLDVVPRAVGRIGPHLRNPWPTFRDVVRERWTREHVVFAVSGLGAWYVCYAAFRNLKSYVPFVRGKNNVYDAKLDKIDKFLWMGHDPAHVLHTWFGTNVAASFFSFIYIAWIVLIPVTLAIALVWTRHPAAGSWFVTAVAVDWVLGVSTYFVLPTLGPIYSSPQVFAPLRHTYVTGLENSLLRERTEVLAGPHATHAVQTIAAFPSLHVGMMVTVCLFVTWAGMPRWIRLTSWVFLVLTVLATIYLGWHFFVDTVAGGLLGAAAVWISAMATGNHVGRRPQLVDQGSYDKPAPGTKPSSSLIRRA
ncbi:MAG: hypothetical protein JWP74_98 [Marmoricola sp.]|nr:hypothetical protein [Marmoricola sp.]